MEDDETNDKLRFLQKYADEVKPVLGDAKKDVFDRIVEGSVSEEEVNESAEEFETKIYSHRKEKGEFDENAKNVLVTIADPGAYNVAAPIIDRLQDDPRARSIKILTHGVSQKSFRGKFGEGFLQVGDPDQPVLADLGQATATPGAPDVVFSTVSAENGPESVALFGGKSVLGAKRIYMVRDGWGGMGSTFDEGKSTLNMDEIDGIFCPDELSKQVVIDKLPYFSRDRIYDFGTPTIDSVYAEDGVDLQRSGREKLGLDDDTIAVLYGGGIQGEWIERYGTDPQIEAKTFSEVVGAIVDVAQNNPDKSYALLVRPHPRDPEKESIYDTSGIDLPKNLQIIPAVGPVISPSEAIYASDVDLTISSTEAFKNLLRGRQAVFLTLEGETMGEGMMQRVLGIDAYNQLQRSGGVKFIKDRLDLTRLISGVIRKVSTKRSEEHESSVDRILDIALASND